MIALRICLTSLSVAVSLSSLEFARAAGEPLPERVIRADVREVKGRLNPAFKECVGAGRANEGLRADWQRQLAQVRGECGFRYLRLHGLFCDDMGVYREDKAGRPQYNWQYIDELYDFLLSIGVKPFVELSFTPKAMASGSQTIFWWKGNVTKPKDLAKWAGLVGAFAAHLKERYGVEEVRTWYFEVWNEPNLSSFFAGTQQDYFDLYAATARALKEVSPEFRVGGPATAGCAWVPEFIQFCVTNPAPVDFITTHTYAVTKGFLDAAGNGGTVFSPDRDSIAGDVRRVRQQIAASALPKLELHFTEWSASYTPSDPIHDSYHSAAFILDRLKRTGDAAQSMSYWVFTDIFEEAGPRWTPFHGGFGLVNYQDIRKPAFFAYQFLHRLGTNELNNADAESWVCTSADGGVQALLWNFTNTHPGTNVNNQNYYNHDLPAAAKERVTLQLAHLAKGRYTLEVRQVGYRTNDAYTAYLDLGAPEQLTRAQVAQLKAASSGAPGLRQSVKVGGDGAYRQEFVLRENDVLLVTLKPER